MPKLIKTLTIASITAAVIAAVLYNFLGYGLFLTVSITCGAIGYHLGFRLLVGAVLLLAPEKWVDPAKPWYQPHPWESTFYRKLRVKAWKDKLPTYTPEAFTPGANSWPEVLRAMCRAELVHEVNAVLSFTPLIASVWFGELPVFLVTSLLAAAFEMLFVVIQRFNRPRVLKLVAKHKHTK